MENGLHYDEKRILMINAKEKEEAEVTGISCVKQANLWF